METTEAESTAPRRGRRLSDLLPERRALARRLTGTSPVPGLRQLQRHAERYGSEAVVETAVELGYGFDSCVRLQDHCDRVESARYLREHPRGRPPKVSLSEDRVRDMMGLEESAA